MDEKWAAVKRLRLCNCRPCEIVKLLHKDGISKQFVLRTLKRFKETGSVEKRHSPGRPRSVRTPEVIKRVRERFRRNPRQSGRKMATKLNISGRTFRRIVSDDLRLRPYKRRKLAGLSADQKQKRLDRCKALLLRHDDEDVENVVFADEKLFMVEEHLNPQNDRIYAAAFEDIPENLRTIEHFQHSSSVMVWGAVSKRGKFPLIFVEKGVKINAQYYRDKILDPIVKEYGPALFLDVPWTLSRLCPSP